jgi:DNA polymerase (family X)
VDVSNGAIAQALEELGDLYELDGAIVHRVLAYRTAAKAVREAPVSVAGLALEGRATELAGIGKTLQEKIVALATSGGIPAAEKLREKYPEGVVRLTRIPGIGAKRARLLYGELGIDSPQALREAALAQRIRAVKGLGSKFEERALSGLERAAAGEQEGTGRLLLPQALELGEALVTGLSASAGGEGATVMVAGSARRLAESVKDIDIVAVTKRPVALAKSLAGLAEMELVSSTSRTGARGRTHSGVGVDLRIGRVAEVGNLWQHFTGSGGHNAALRERAVRAGMHVSEHGIVFDGSRSGNGAQEGRGRTSANGRQGAPRAGTPRARMCESEAEVYELLGYEYIEPELREDRGELQAAAGGGEGLPALIELADIRGDLHCHTIASDGHNTIAEMAGAARERGYEYLAITDHSASHGFGNDVSASELERQIERVRRVDGELEGIRVLAGSEVNVLADGGLDYEDGLLAELDWVVASVHTSFGMDEGAMTRRVVAAMEHPLVDAIGHPTGRLIERREPYGIDLEAVFAGAARTGTLLEINGNPRRRDLSETNARAAVRAGARLVIDSDGHRVETLANMRWGVATARRGWVRREEVANTLPWEELQRLRKRNRG